MAFTFTTATKIIFGPNTLSQLEGLLPDIGRHPLVVTGQNPDRAAPLYAILDTLSMSYDVFSVEKEPTIDVAKTGTEQARSAGCDMVIGFGGGSVVDTAKAIAGLMTNDGEPLDYLEVIGKGQPLLEPAAPFIAVPTTAGTGSEVTSNAVLASPEHRVKVSLRHPKMLATIALVDSTLTMGVPPDVTARTGLDALTQCLEPYVSHLANPLTDGLCVEGMRRAARSLRKVYTDGDDLQARDDMALTSLFGGLALSNAKLGAVHGFAGPFGGMFDAPHGAICAALLPHVMAANVRILRERDPDNIALPRYDEIGRILTGRDDATVDDGIAWVQETVDMMAIPGLRSYGFTDADLPALLEKSGRSSSMKGNPIKLTDDDMTAILHAAQ